MYFSLKNTQSLTLKLCFENSRRAFENSFLDIGLYSCARKGQLLLSEQ